MVYYNKLIDNIQVTILEERLHSNQIRRIEVWFEDEDNITYTSIENVLEKPHKVVQALKDRGFKLNETFLEKLLDFIHNLELIVVA